MELVLHTCLGQSTEYEPVFAQHGFDLSTPSIAQMLSNTLYQKRFFPYYTFNICAGLDKDGKGCVYGYDAVGSFERGTYITEGSGVSLIQPLLDKMSAAVAGSLLPLRATIVLRVPRVPRAPRPPCAVATSAWPNVSESIWVYIAPHWRRSLQTQHCIHTS